MAYRKVPKKIVVTGDIDRGRTYIGQADSQLNILQNQMRFQNLDQGWRTVKLAEDVVVECWSCFSLSAVHIHATPPKPAEKKKEELIRECLCLPCFTAGIVEKVYPEEVTEDDLIKGVRFTYDISVCNDTLYILFKDFRIRSAGWEQYYAGQAVWVALDAAHDAPPSCCNDSECLISEDKDFGDGALDSLAVLPVYFPELKKWYVKTLNI